MNSKEATEGVKKKCGDLDVLRGRATLVVVHVLLVFWKKTLSTTAVCVAGSRRRGRGKKINAITAPKSQHRIHRIKTKGDTGDKEENPF